MKKDTLIKIATSKGFLVGATAVISLAVGGYGGYALTNERLKYQYNERSKRELREANDYYSRLAKVGKYADPVVLANAYTDSLDSYGPTLNTSAEFADVAEAIQAVEDLQILDGVPDPQDQVCEIEENVFAKATYEGEEFNYEEEERLRTLGKPYILTSDEFFQNEAERNQSNLTFFEGDGVLIDEQEIPIQEPDLLVGKGNLDRFGYGSGDKNVLYVRNEKLDLEFEIIRSERMYTEEVLGFTHSDDRVKTRKFRGEDE